MCSKVKYSKKDAQSALSHLVKSGRWNRKSDYGRIYECKDCGLWHITASSYIKEDDVEIELINKNKFNDLLNKSYG
jgi:hypothetical protein